MRCVLVGNYGVANLGDEALKDYFLTAFPDIDWTALSARPERGELPRLPVGIRSFFLTPWWKTVGAIRSADAVIFGGGTLFTDIESPLACILWFLHARTAFFFGTPYFLAFQGVGPFRTGIGKRLAIWVLRHAAFVSVRDEKSAQRVDEIIMNTKCVRTFDPVILSIQKEDIVRSKNVINIIPRHNSGAELLEAAQALAKNYPDAAMHILLLQPDSNDEQQIAHNLSLVLNGKVKIFPVRSLAALCSEVAGSRVVLSERYHGAIAALAVGTPVHIIAQAKDDKLSDLQRFEKDPSGFSALLDRARSGQVALKQALQL